MKRLVKFLSVLSVSLLLANVATALPALYVHYDASDSANVVVDGSDIVLSLTDLSTSGFDATQAGGAGTLLYSAPGNLSPTGLKGVDTNNGAHNKLLVLTDLQQDALLDFSGAAASNTGFAALVVFKADTVAGSTRNLVLASHGNATTSPGSFIMKYESGIPQVVLGGTSVNAGAGAAVVADGETVVLAVNYNKATGNMEVWDSENNTPVSVTKTAADFSSVQSLFLAGSENNGQGMDGMIGEVKIFQGVLTPQEFADEQNALVDKWIDTTPIITSSLSVDAPLNSPIADYQITTDTDGTPNEPVSYAANGLPNGLSLNALTGVISGTATESGSFNVNLSATNSLTEAGTAVLVLTVTDGIVITSSLTDSVELGSLFIYQIETNKDTAGTPDAPILYNATGLPDGLTLNQTGEISGTPTESGTFSVNLAATNDLDKTATAVLELTVTDPLPVITSAAAITATASSPITYTITASNNPISFSVVGLGVLPTDSVDTANLSSTGAFTFTPSVSAIGNSYNLILKATNAAGTTSQVLVVTVLPAVPPAPSVATVTLISPVPSDSFIADTTSLTVSATVTPAAGESLDTVFVRWNNPPAKPDGTPRAPIILAQLTNTAGDVYEAEVDIGFDPENREIGGGLIDLEVVAYQTNANSPGDFASDAVSIEIAPLAQFIFPTAGFIFGSINVGDLFASVLINTNNFVSVTARISGTSLIDTVIDVDNSNNQNGVFTFAASEAIDFAGEYRINITVLDGSGASTLLERTFTISENASGPTAVITLPLAGASFEVFAPALVEMNQVGSNATDNIKKIEVNGVQVDKLVSRTFTFNYGATLISGGQGYYPLDASSFRLLGQVSDGAALDFDAIEIAGVTLADGRVLNVPATLSYSVTRTADGDGAVVPWSGFGLNPLVVLDSPVDQGSPAQIIISAELIRANAPLASFKIFVNGEDVTPGIGNLNSNFGALDVPLLKYPETGAPAPGDYVVVVEVTDQDGKFTSATSGFSVTTYDPAPTVVITSPTPGASYTAGDVITIDVSATDEAPGFVTSVTIFVGATEIGPAIKVSDTEWSLDLPTSLADLGELQLGASATDDRGNVSALSLQVPVQVVSGNLPTVTIDSPADGASYTQGDLIALEITAGDADGFVTSVEIFNGDVLLGTALKISGDQYRYTIDTAEITAGTLTLSARATDNIGNPGSDSVSVDLSPIVFSVSVIDPTENPLILRSAISPIEQVFTVEITAADAAAIQSVQWYFADQLIVESAIVADTLSYTETLNLAKSGELRVKVTDAVSGISVEDTVSVIVSINIETPLNSDEAFVRDAYVRLTATEPTDTYVANAVAQMDGTTDGQVAYLEVLFDSSAMVETEQVLMVYRTMTGEWPDATELAAARAGLLGGTVATAAAPGSIEAGVTQQTFEFFYNAGDTVTVSVTGAGDDPLLDPTLVITSPSGAVIAFDDDSGLGLNPLVNFIATEAGTYSAIVAGFSIFQSGDFTISSSATNLGGSTSASLEVLVQSLIPEFEARFNMTFPTTSVGLGTEAKNLVVQLFKNKHGGTPSSQPERRLYDSLTLASGSLPGYSGNLSAFTVAFALDNSRSSTNSTKSSVHQYVIPNQPIDDVPLALMIAMFLGEDPSDQALAAYAGMTQAQAFESIITDPRYYVQFPSSGVESFVSLKLADLGVFDQSLNGPANDADDDGVSNLMEIALGSDPSDPSDTIVPMATDLEGTEFVITFIRIKASEVPGDFIISLECSEDLTVWDAAADTASVTSTEGVIQDGVPEGYERVEIRIDMNERACGFFRLSVDLP